MPAGLASNIWEIFRSPYRLVAALALVLLSGLATAQSGPDKTAKPASFDELIAAATAARSTDLPRAIALYSQAEQLRPEWPAGWWFLGLLQYSTKAWPAARDSLTHYIDLTPPGTPAAAQAIALRGLSEFETGDFALSLADIERAIQLNAASDSENATLLRYRQALALNRLGRFEESQLMYASLVAGMDSQENAPDKIDAEFKVGAGLAGLRKALLPGEVSATERAMYAAAGDAMLRLLKGSRTGNTQDGAKAFASFFARYPKAANAHYLFGYLMLPTDPDTTIVEYKDELSIAPDNVTAGAMLAWVLQSQDDPAGALPYAKKAVDEAPSLPVAQLVLGRSLAQTGHLDDGIQHLEKALQLQPGYLETHVALASAYASAGREEDARRERIQSLHMAEATVAKH